MVANDIHNAWQAELVGDTVVYLNTDTLYAFTLTTWEGVELLALDWDRIIEQPLLTAEPNDTETSMLLQYDHSHPGLLDQLHIFNFQEWSYEGQIYHTLKED